MTDVRANIARHGWEVFSDREDVGFYDDRQRPGRVVGSKRIQAELGDYQSLPFEASVTGYWGFDEESKLIDVWVRKTWEGF